MAYVLIDKTIKGTTGSTVTTDAISTLGADLLVVVEAVNGSATMTVADSQSNTWANFTLRNAFGREMKVWYVQNPSTSGTHTVTGTSDQCRVSFSAWSGSTASPADGENTNSGVDVTTLTVGSVTPSQSGDLLIAGSYTESMSGGTGSSVDSGYTKLHEVNDGTWGLVVGYKIKTDAAAENPTITFAGTTHVANAVHAAFLAAATASGAAGPLVNAPLLKSLTGRALVN